MKDLEGKTIAITRPAERCNEAVKIIKAYGGIPFVAPTLELKILKSKSLIKLCKMADELDWIIFTSPAAVKSFFESCDDATPNCKIAVIGPKTREVLGEYGRDVDLIPDNYTAEGLLDAFENFDIEDKKIGLPRTMIARNLLPEGLKKRGAHVFLAEAYKSGIPKDRSRVYQLIEWIITRKVDIITFTSPLTVKNLFKVAKGEDRKRLIKSLRADIIVAAIGPITKKALMEYGIDAISPDEYTVKAMLMKVAHHLQDIDQSP